MCVQYAVDYPNRLPAVSDALDLFSVGRLSFAAPDGDAFPLLPLARRAIAMGGAVPAVMNAADEIAVEAFLNSKIDFVGISDLVLSTVDRLSSAASARSLDEILAYDKEARALAKSLIKQSGE
jgi:1-deoxy-D-xylulose-5-phosphate reductoisomerase